MIKMIKKNILSLFIAVVILFLSFARAETFSAVNVFGLQHLDKVVHFTMYFTFTIVLLFENRLIIKNAKSLLVLSVIPFIFGSLIEILQSWLTTSRRGDFFDVLINLIGIFLAAAAWSLYQNFIKNEN